MAKEWYLLSRKYGEFDQSDVIMSEAYDSIAGSDVEIYNYDLSECRQVRCIVQNNLQDSKLNSTVRHILCPINSVKAGEYVKYEGNFYIVYGFVGNNNIYEKGVMHLCTNLLEWQDEFGMIHQRWAYAINATQYNNGETNKRNFILRTDQLVLTLPDDQYSMSLTNGKRFVIDKRTKYYTSKIEKEADLVNGYSNTTNPLITYQLTRSDSVVFDYQDGGVYQFMATEDEQHEQDGYFYINGQGHWLCEPNMNLYKSSDQSEPHAKIISEEDVVYIKGYASVFDSVFYKEDGSKDEEAVAEWFINGEVDESELNVERNESSISISTDNKKLLNKEFDLVLYAEGYDPVYIPIVIRIMM